MVKSKTKIEKQVKNKLNPELVETIRLAKKHPAWIEVAGFLSSPRKNWSEINLSQLNEKTKNNEKVIIPGKVLSQGELDKKIKVVAFSFSEKAKEKLIKDKIDFSTIMEEIKSNKDMKGVKVLK